MAWIPIYTPTTWPEWSCKALALSWVSDLISYVTTLQISILKISPIPKGLSPGFLSIRINLPFKSSSKHSFVSNTLVASFLQADLGGGVTPLGGGSIYPPGAKKLGHFYTFSAPKAPRKIFEHFFRNSWEICYKNAIKSSFWGVVGRYISEISKKSPFSGKKNFYKIQKFRKYFYRGGVTPLKNHPGFLAISAIASD